MEVLELTLPRVQETADNEMLSALGRQRQSFLRDGPPSAAVRRDRIARAAELLRQNKDALCDAVRSDFGHRSRHETLLTDVYPAIEALEAAHRNVKRWMRPRRRRVQFPLNLTGARAQVRYQPLGVVGVISPWNFPISLTFTPLAGILAAGNRAMIKPSELTPATSALLGELCRKTFDETEVSVHTGGADVGAAFSALPFDHLLFTGSTQVGRHIMRAAAENLVPVTLELGGKSPVVLSRTADVEAAAERITTGKMMNAGQICLAPDYVLVHRDRLRPLVDAIRQSVRRHYPTMLHNPDYTSVINGRHLSRLASYVRDARDKGATIIELNPASERFDDQPAHKMPLTLVLEPTDDMRVMQEEIFGPVLPIVAYDRIDEAIAYVNARPRPLALYYFGADRQERQRVLSRTTSGGVSVNDVVTHVAIDDLPFGGVGPSGMGAYHGHAGFRTFSHEKAIFTQSRRSVADLLKPPYGRLAERVLKFLIG